MSIFFHWIVALFAYVPISVVFYAFVWSSRIAKQSNNVKNASRRFFLLRLFKLVAMNKKCLICWDDCKYHVYGAGMDFAHSREAPLYSRTHNCVHYGANSVKLECNQHSWIEGASLRVSSRARTHFLQLQGLLILRVCGTFFLFAAW